MNAVDLRPVVGLIVSEPGTDDLLAWALGQAGFLCSMVRPEVGRVATIRQIRSCRALLKSFGAFSPGYFRLFLTAKVLRRKVVLYWIGSDVLRASNEDRRWAQRIQRLVDLNLTVCPWLQDELRAEDIEARVVPIVSGFRDLEPYPMPPHPTVLAYIPASRPDFYGASILVALAGKLEHVRFLVVGGTGSLHLGANVEDLGVVRDMTAVYRRSTILLRLTQHDGLPKMVLEALTSGRKVIWNRPFPHCRLATTVEEAEAAIRSVLAQPPAPDLEAARFVHECYSPSVMVEGLRDALLGLMDASPPRR